MATLSIGKRKLLEEGNTPTEQEQDETFKNNLLSDLIGIQDKLNKQHLNKQSKMIIRNIYRYFQCEKEIGEPLIDPAKAIRRCLVATGITHATLNRTLKEIPDKTDGHKAKKRNRKVDISPADSELLRRTMHRFYKENLPVNLDRINQEFRKCSDLRVSITTLWKILGQIGFHYGRRTSRLHVYEMPEIMQKRDNYIREITEIRKENNKIYYQDETWLNAGYIPKKGWLDTNIEKDIREVLHPGSSLNLGYKDPSGKGQRLIISHVGSEEGFLENGADIFVSGKKADYHHDMNAIHYEEHLKTNVLPRIKNSVLVVDNASYHSRILEKVPSKSSKKSDIVEWLKRRELPHDPKNTKLNLMKIVNCNKPQNNKSMCLEQIAKQFNVKILRLPPYHCELNPIELIWAQLKGNVARRNTTFKISDVQRIALEEITKIDRCTWQKAIEHVVKIEQDYSKNLFPLIKVRPLIIEIDHSDSESEPSLQSMFSDSNDDNSSEEEF